ncbi:hypothetical protein HK102_001571, partial [Quaeritorhiza haematococci]
MSANLIPSLLSRTATATVTAALTRSAATASLRMYTTHIRDAGGKFSEREKAQEEKWIHDHEKEVLDKFKQKLANKPAAEEQPAAQEEQRKPDPTPPGVDAKHIAPGGVDSTYGGAVRGGGGALGKKGAAVEEKYFRDHDKELFEKLKGNQ